MKLFLAVAFTTFTILIGVFLIMALLLWIAERVVRKERDRHE